jgi:hypothetical protein
MTDLNTAGSYNGMLFKHADYQVMCNKIEALWQEQWFKDAVITKWNTIYGESKSKDLLALLTAKIDVLAAEIAQTQADNYASKANGGAGWELTGDYSAAVQTIKTYLNQRFEYLDTKFKELAASSTRKGDINGDGEVNVADVTTLVDYILGKNPTNCNESACDINGDNEINVSDVTSLVDIILGK